MTNTYRVGYQHTALGWIPEEWEVVLLDDVSTRGSGHTPSKAFEEYYHGGIKWVSLTDSFRLDNGIILETNTEISEEGIKNSSATIHPAGTVLMSRDAGVGKSAIMGIDMAVSQHFITWTCKPMLHNWFLYHWLQFRKEFFESQAVGSTIKTIGLSFFRKLQIPLPPLDEQVRIAAILGTWDQAVEKQTALCEQLRLRNKGLGQQLLSGQKRLPGFEEEWSSTSISDLVEESRIKGSNGLHAQKITVKLYGKGVFAKDEKVSGSENTQYFIRKYGQLIYSKLDFLNGAFGIIPKHLDGLESTLDLPCFDINRDIVLPNFLLAYVSREAFYLRQAGGAVGGRKAKRVQVNEFFAMNIELPSLPEQKAIAQVLDTAAAELSMQEEQLAQLQQQKRGLMQQLLTGAVRV